MANINIEKVKELISQSDKILFKPEGEAVLVELLHIQEQVDMAIIEAKRKLEEAALKINPNFSSIQGDHIKVYYRSYGQKYFIDESQLSVVPKELYTAEEKVTYKLDVKALEKWADEKGLPVGIKEIERPKTLSISLKGGKNVEE